MFLNITYRMNCGIFHSASTQTTRHLNEYMNQRTKKQRDKEKEGKEERYSEHERFVLDATPINIIFQ